MHSYGTYGTRRVASVNNAPGGRYSAAYYYYAANNTLFLYGGWGYPDGAYGLFFFVARILSDKNQSEWPHLCTRRSGVFAVYNLLN